MFAFVPRTWRAIVRGFLSLNQSDFHRIGTASIFWIGTAYFGFRDPLKETFHGWTLVHTLNGIFQPRAAMWICWGVFFYSAVIQFVTQVLMPSSGGRLSQGETPKSILASLITINDEIEGHLKKMSSDPSFSPRSLHTLHQYGVNIGAVVQRLAFFLIDHFHQSDLSTKDVFLSFYHNPEMERYLESPDDRKRRYLEKVVHYNEVWEAGTPEIDLISSAHRGFACTAAYLEHKKLFLANLSPNDYIKGDVQRRQTVVQYIGIPVNVNGKAVAWLNIEIHNKAIFKNQNAIQKFYLDHLRPFEHLLRYQVLKKIFFARVSGGAKNELDIPKV